MTVDDVAEVGPEDVVPEYEYEVVVDVRFSVEKGMGESQLLALVSVSDRDVFILVAIALNDLFLEVADDELGDTNLD